MEPTEVKKRGRGRPRKRRREEEEIEKKVASALEMSWRPLVGRYVLKEFVGGIYLGKVVRYSGKYYRVVYEDTDFEDLESGELRDIVLDDNYFDSDLSTRKKVLDDFLRENSEHNKGFEKNDTKLKLEADEVETSLVSELSDGAQAENDVDSLSDSSEYVQDRDSGLEVGAPIVPPPQLPPSSGTIGVPEEYVSHLLSVYAFLRSFNIRLFLSPFTLNDFVGAINCPIQNTLLDAIHVALMRALRPHLELLSSDGSELASKCLRCIDWSLLDSLTWPIYLVHYFTVMGYAMGSEWEEFSDDLLKRDYYSLPVSRKLMLLQILCDDALDSAELRTEMDMREESEVGIDPDASITNLPESGPRRGRPRYSTTSACKERESVETIAENQGTRFSFGSNYFGSKVTKWDACAPDVGIDGNSDECRLCGMDGTLLCCDGCPSAYHSRCIGVSKMHIPEGPWLCPECTINNLGPAITMGGTSLRGAVVFGIDSYEQVFLGTCNHLLVLRASASNQLCLRYYNCEEIPKVLQLLFASVQHRSLYLGIAKAIAQYWHISETVFSPLEMMETGLNTETVEIDDKFSHLLAPGYKANHSEAENAVSSNGSSVDNLAVSCPDTSIHATTQADTLSNGDVTRAQNCHLSDITIPTQMKIESCGSVNHQNNQLDVPHLSLVDNSNATCTSANSDGSHIGCLNASCAPAIMSSLCEEGSRAVSGRLERNISNSSFYMGTFFKPNAYINYYMHGDFAAAAAANLAHVLSEESRISEAHKPGNARKAVSDISLQVKAFSTAASRFFWPSSERKLMEVPRERCGWCYSCKITSNSKKACMLNAAALTATRGAMKILSGLRPREGSLSSISTYILYMGEILCGLTVGPFLSSTYRKQWRKQVEDASNCAALKGPLLELEENIRTIALCGDWIKGMDDWLVECSVVQTAANTVGNTHKHRVTGKRRRKQSALSEGTTDDCQDKSFTWWRGGKLSKLVFHKAILPISMVKRAARQGGSKKMSGVYYADDSEVLPKRSRQLVWRAAVERSKNASQLALQVRYLDFNVRWSDLVRPDQSLLDGKGPETDASVFRNAIICDKKIEENKIRYGVAFGNQKHLPSRIMKNVIEIQQSEAEKEKYWFSEIHVPLYLIKEYEESIDNVDLPLAQKSSNKLSKLQKQQLKASRKDIFLYLTCKRDKLDKCSCASCQQDVLLRNTVKCSSCQGYCHADCTLSSTAYTNEEVEFLITCNRCYNAKAIADNVVSNRLPTSHLPVPLQATHNAVKVTKGIGFKIHNQSLVSTRTPESCTEMKQTASFSSKVVKTRKFCNWGVIWRKKNTNDTGIEFRKRNILQRGCSDTNWPTRMLICVLCEKPYNSDLMYIHCDVCNRWYHAEAVELDESKLSDVVGFKCCRCRRIKSPSCPYEEQKSRKKVMKQGSIGVDYDSGTIMESKESEPNTPIISSEELFIQDDDPLLFSLSKVEQVAESNSGVDFEWNTSGQGPQKLPVRRHGKHQEDAEGTSENNFYHTISSVPIDTNNPTIPKLEFPCVEWDVPTNGPEDVMLNYEDLNYENMEYEPQTYFSFNELLESDDGGQLDGLEDGVTSGDQLDLMTSSRSAVSTVPCTVCSCLEPVPDLCCEVCGLVIHHHCNPWDESSPIEGSWRCLNCREWR